MSGDEAAYLDLMNRFVRGELDGAAFADAFVRTFKADDTMRPEPVFEALNDVFGAAEGFDPAAPGGQPFTTSPAELRAAVDDALGRLAPPDDDERQGFVEIVNDESARDEERALARRAYTVLLETRRVSTCPFTGRAVDLAIDAVGLDGPYWDARSPARRESPLPTTVFSITGAMELHPPLASAPFLCVPGPTRLFIIRELLALDSVVAVVSSLAIGRHRGFPIAYFSTTRADDRLRLNEWGSRSYRYSYEDGSSVDGESKLYDGDNDYDVTPWIEAGKLRWIAPGDDAWEVRSGLDGFPFTSMIGPGTVQRIVDGELA